MRRSFLPLVLAVVVVACGGGGTDPTSVDIRQPPFWEGTVTFSRHSVFQGLDETLTLEGPVTWTKEQDPNLERGTVSYRILSGSLAVTHTGKSGQCTLNGKTTLLLKAGNGFLVLNTDRTYSGYIRSETRYDLNESCPGSGAKPLDPGNAAIDLEMRGKVADTGRMQGTMPELTLAVITFNGSWNFLPSM